MKIERYKNKAGDHAWRVSARNGEVLAQGEGYRNANDMEETIEEVTGVCIGYVTKDADRLVAFGKTAYINREQTAYYSVPVYVRPSERK